MRSAPAASPLPRRIEASVASSGPDCSAGSVAAFDSRPSRMALASSAGARATSRARSTSSRGSSTMVAGIFSHCCMAAAMPCCLSVATMSRSQSCGSSLWALIARVKKAVAVSASPAATRESYRSDASWAAGTVSARSSSSSNCVTCDQSRSGAGSRSWCVPRSRSSGCHTCGCRSSWSCPSSLAIAS